MAACTDSAHWQQVSKAPALRRFALIERRGASKLIFHSYVLAWCFFICPIVLLLVYIINRLCDVLYRFPMC